MTHLPALHVEMDPLMSSFSIPPELFPLIASFIPLRAARQTLLSLALCNQHFYSIVRPLLYSRLVLGNEDDAILVIQKILDEPQLGMAVTEIHIMAELSSGTREGKKPFDAVKGLQRLVNKKLLPRLVTLGIYLLNGWEYDDDWKPILGHGHLYINFWRTLHVECPRLQSLSLRNLGHGSDDPWLLGPVVKEILNASDLSVLRLKWMGLGLSSEDHLTVLKSLPQFATSLQALSLKSNYQDVGPMLDVDFPNLKWLRLFGFSSDNTSKSMAFFRRHPQLESLSVIDCMHDWFSKDVDNGFLPNLKHLKATFSNIRRLTSVLPQLVSLSFTESHNCQVPYLLREVLPNGLPNLKSLEIEETIAGWQNRKMEGILWYETEDGQFLTEKNRKKIPRDFTQNYLHSIVRGAPNLEELALHGVSLGSDDLETLAPTLAGLKSMKRFYYRGFSTYPKYGSAPLKEDHEELLAEFLSSAEAFAHVCTGLESVTSISGRYLPYPSARIQRDSSGVVTGVRRSDGVGLEISANVDDPFPINT